MTVRKTVRTTAIGQTTGSMSIRESIGKTVRTVSVGGTVRDIAIGQNTRKTVGTMAIGKAIRDIAIGQTIGKTIGTRNEPTLVPIARKIHRRGKRRRTTQVLARPFHRQSQAHHQRPYQNRRLLNILGKIHRIHRHPIGDKIRPRRMNKRLARIRDEEAERILPQPDPLEPLVQRVIGEIGRAQPAKGTVGIVDEVVAEPHAAVGAILRVVAGRVLEQLAGEKSRLGVLPVWTEEGMT